MQFKYIKEDSILGIRAAIRNLKRKQWVSVGTLVATVAVTVSLVILVRHVVDYREKTEKRITLLEKQVGQLQKQIEAFVRTSVGVMVINGTRIDWLEKKVRGESPYYKVAEVYYTDLVAENE